MTHDQAQQVLSVLWAMLVIGVVTSGFIIAAILTYFIKKD